MRRILGAVTITAVAVALATTPGCGGGDGGDDDDAGAPAGEEEAGPGDPAEAILTLLDQQIAGQWGPLYDRLHPEHQALVTRDAFVACGQRMQADNPVVTTSATRIDVVDTFEEEVTLPGTDTRAQTLAATVEISDRGASAQRTFHLMEVGGEWRWMLAEAQLAEC